MRPLVVIPTYNEAENIERMLQRVDECLPGAGVLVVDDGSPDGTAELVEAATGRYRDLHLLRRNEKSGLGSAYRAGFGWGLERGYDAFIEMDCDFSHDPAVLPELVGALQRGADLVIGSRYVPGGSIPDWSPTRRAISSIGCRYARLLLGVDVRDLTSGYRVFSAAALRAVDLDAVRADGYGFQVEMAYRVTRNGGTVVEVPIEFRDRTLGRSKMSLRIVVEALLLVTWWGVRDLVRGRRRRARVPARA